MIFDCPKKEHAISLIYFYTPALSNLKIGKTVRSVTWKHRKPKLYYADVQQYHGFCGRLLVELCF
jgi:hypothetical protein